jgi:hypothetical protein
MIIFLYIFFCFLKIYLVYKIFNEIIDLFIWLNSSMEFQFSLTAQKYT